LSETDHAVRPQFLKPSRSVRLALALAFVFTSALVVEVSPLFVSHSWARVLFLSSPWRIEESEATSKTRTLELFVSRDFAGALNRIGITPAEGVAIVLGAVVILLVLAGIGVRTAARSSRESEERFAKIFRSSPLAITITTQADGRYLDVNKAFLQMLGYERKEVIGHSALGLNVWVDPMDRIKMLHSTESSKTIRTRMRTRGGDIREVSVSAELIELDGLPCVLAITQDVTETQLLEEQFRQAHKMEALGRLAAGVAHDFNNLLCVTIGYSELSLQYLDPTHPLVRNLVEIKKAADRAATLTRRLLGFSRQQILFPRILDLNTVIDSLNQMLLRLIGEDIALVFKPATDLGRIQADLGQIEQVLMNLIVNARDAMPRGGTIIVETANVHLEDSYLDSHFSVPPGRYVMLALSDSGSGMDARIASRIFEPFFTTKAPGQGSGLGLSTVYGIVKQSDGHIWVYSEPGQGTTFKLYFPVRAESADPGPQPLQEAEPLNGVERVLVVEDDESLRNMITTLLESVGYHVLAAATAESAVRILQSLEGTLELLVTDILLPDLNGVELAALFKKSRPDLRVLLMSGYTGAFIEHYKTIDPNVKLLEKPFSRRALLATIYDTLHN